MSGGDDLQTELARLRAEVDSLMRQLAQARARNGEDEESREASIHAACRADQAIEPLRVLEERSRLALEASDVAWWDFDVSSQRMTWSEQQDRLLGLGRGGDDRSLNDLLDRVHPEDADRVRERFSLALKGLGPIKIDFRVVRANDGAVRWISSYGRAVAGDGTRITRLIGMMLDSTERQESNRQLAVAQELWRIVVESALEHAIITTDLDRDVLTWNAGAEKIIGYSAPEMIGRSMDIFFTEEDRARGRPVEEARLCLEKGSASDDRWHERKDGSRFFANGVMVPLRLRPDGEILGFVKIIRDQTQVYQDRLALERSRIKLVEALSAAQHAREELEAAGQAKDHFLAVLSHELRTPLTPVLMAARTLSRRSDLPAPVQEGLEMIRRNIQLEARFIDDLLDVTRIARGKMELAFAPVDFHELVQSAVDISRPDFEARNQQLVLALEATQPCMEGDPERLQQVVWNLLKNASKFSPAEGRIRVRTRNGPGTLILEVSDNGIGIGPEARDGIFDPFSQANQEITRQFGGLGLGLAISKATVAGHGGHIAVESGGPGKGSTFMVTLPLKMPGQSNA